MQDNNIFRGRLAIGLFCSLMSWSIAIATSIYIGGGPEEPLDGQYFLGDHGRLTEVSYAVWILAYACETTLIIAWISTVVFIFALVLRKTSSLAETDVRKDYSILILSGLIMVLLLPTIASLL